MVQQQINGGNVRKMLEFPSVMNNVRKTVYEDDMSIWINYSKRLLLLTRG